MATDGELLSQYAKAGSEESFSELVGRHGPMVLASCRRLVGQLLFGCPYAPPPLESPVHEH